MTPSDVNNPVRSWIIGHVLANPKKAIFLPVLVTLIMGAGISYLVVDDDMMAMLPETLDSRMSWDAVQDEFGSTEVIFIAFGNKDKTIYSSKTFSLLWDLAKALENLDQVEKVSCLTTISRIDSENGFMEISDLQPVRDLSAKQIDKIKQYLKQNPTIKQRAVSASEEYFNIMVQPYEDIPHDVMRNVVVTIGDSVLPAEYEVHYGGTAYITGSVPTMIRNDITVLLRVGLFIMAIVLMVNLRNPFAVVMVFAVIIQSLIVMAGFMGWMVFVTGSERFYFTIINASMPIILLTIANSDGVHFVAKFFKEMRKKKDTKKSLESTMDTLLVPIFLTSLTTIAAFLSLSFAPIKQLMGYGVCISVGIAHAFILSSTFLPAGIYLKKWDMSSKAVTRPSIFENLIVYFGKTVTSNPKSILGAGVLIASAGIVGLLYLKVDVNIASFFRPGTEFRDSIDFIDQEMTGTMDIRVRLEGSMKNPRTLNEIVNLQDMLENNNKVTTSFSIADVVKQMHRVVMDDDPEFETIPEDQGKVNNLFSMYSMSGDPEDFSTMVDYEYSVGLVTALSRVMTTDEIISIVDKIEEYVGDLKSVGSASVTGMAVVIRDLVYLVVQSSVISIVMSVILIGLITSLFFKRIAWGMMAIIPLSVAVVINFGFMGLAGIHLSHVTALLASVIIGVGVDFAIHYISQYRRLSKISEKNMLTNDVIEDVGYPIILDSASNMSFGALLFSAFIPVQYMGGLMVFAMISTSIGTLTFLAAMAELLKHNLAGK
ncbi:MAG: MMPL family transporter [Candidatus Marinimicrobia bacterium]|nr:MMPL family transporter [Candidatus Neomarinimicrobiota bacterium]